MYEVTSIVPRTGTFDIDKIQVYLVVDSFGLVESVEIGLSEAEELACDCTMLTDRDFYVLHRTTTLGPPEPPMVINGLDEGPFF
jgi:hypothetical protein